MIGWLIAWIIYGSRPAPGLAVVLILIALLAGSPLATIGPMVRDTIIELKLSCLCLMALYVGFLTAGSFALLPTVQTASISTSAGDLPLEIPSIAPARAA